MYRPSHPPSVHPTTPPRTFAYALLSEKINAATPICLLACSLACFLVNLISTSAPSYRPHYHLLSTRGLLAQASYACVLDPCSNPASVSQPRFHMLPPSISSPPGPYITLARLEAATLSGYPFGWVFGAHHCCPAENTMNPRCRTRASTPSSASGPPVTPSAATT